VQNGVWNKAFDEGGVNMHDTGAENQQHKSLTISGIKLFINSPETDPTDSYNIHKILDGYAFSNVGI